MTINDRLINLCDDVVSALIRKEYDKLNNINAFERVSINDLNRVLMNYGGVLTPIPKQAYESDAFSVYTYNDGSGYQIDLDLWINDEQSDLTIKLDVQLDVDSGEIVRFRIMDLLVM